MDSLATKLTPNAVKRALETLPNDLRETYDEAMERIESQGSECKQLAIRILYWIFYALRPLTVQELQHALAVEPETSELDEGDIPDKELLTSLCAGLVVTDQKSNIIRFAHYTAQEYFERTGVNWFPEAQKDIAITCLHYLSFDAFLDGYCSSDEMFEARLNQNPLFDYAARNWGHFALGNAERSVQDLAFKFLKDDSKVSGLSQALLISEDYRYPGYSQSPPRQFSGMHVVAYFGLHNIMKLLLAQDGVNPDPKDGYGRTPLSWAAAEGHEAVVKLLLAREDIDPNSKDRSGWTPLLWAVVNGHEAVVKLLLAREGVNPDSKDRSGRTPLWWAVQNWHEAVVKLLLENQGVDPDSKGGSGRTPLSWAAENGHEAVVKLLLAREDVDPDFKDGDGRTPLWWAARNGHEAVVKLLLTREGVDSDSEDGYGRTPLSWAALNGHEAVVKLLLTREGVDPDSKDGFGQTPLSWAAENGHEAVVRLLLEKGADITAKDDSGQTALHWAIRNRRKAVVRLLVEKGADVATRNNSALTRQAIEEVKPPNNLPAKASASQ
jgi:ankyrin repeat protein